MSTTSLTITRESGIEVSDINSDDANSIDIADLTARVTDLVANVNVLKVMVTPVNAGIQTLQANVSNVRADILSLKSIPEPNVTVGIVGGEVTAVERSTNVSTILVSKADLDALAATISS